MGIFVLGRSWVSGWWLSRVFWTGCFGRGRAKECCFFGLSHTMLRWFLSLCFRWALINLDIDTDIDININRCFLCSHTFCSTPTLSRERKKSIMHSGI